MLVREWLPGRKQRSVSNLQSKMAVTARSLALSVLFLTFSWVSYGQGSGGTSAPPSGSPAPAGSPSSSAPSTGPSSSGTFSIEAEIFGYKSLQSDSEAIACDIAGFVYPTDGISALPYGKNTLITPSDWTDEDARHYEPRAVVCQFKGDKKPGSSAKGVVILPSTSNAIANYQLWRLDMTIMHLYLQQAASMGCPAKAPQAAGTVNFLFDPTIISQVITVVQSALQLFANSESALEVTGTIQDQALVDGIARELRNLKVPVLVPDLYTSFSLTNSDYTDSPLLSTLVQLVVQRNCLQNSLQDAQAELKKITDVTAERDSYLKIRSDVLEKEIDPKLTAPEKKVLDDQVNSIQTKLDALNKQLDVLNGDGAQTTISGVQSLTSTIDAFVATLLGATPASSTPATASAAPTSSPAPAGSPAPNPAASPAAPATSAATGNPSPTPAPSGSVPPIVSALAGDGLGRRLFPKKANDYTLQDTDWRVLSVKALESGGALITTTNIFGSKVHFSGGAVATYALFSLHGDLECSGNVFDYGGYLRPSQFTKKFRRPNLEPDKQLLFLRGGCAPAEPDNSGIGPK